MSRSRIFSIFLLSISVGACASAGSFNTTPADIPRLEQEASARPDDADVNTALGVAYFRADRFEEARTVLKRVVDAGSQNGDAYLYLGLANEQLKDWTSARGAYEKYIEVGSDGDAKERVRDRLSLVAREELRQSARVVLEREQQMSDDPPTPRTVAVMPFRLVGTSEELAPLQTALSDMIITDLSVSPAITSIERVKINAMIDEMLLAQAGLAESTTGARVGRLLKAEHVVQGVLAQSGQEQLRMDATVLNTERREATGSFGRDQQLNAIFDLEKEIVFNIFSTLGVTLTAAERERINENRAGNLLAFLAYGRGLDAMDEGNFQQAATFFRQAVQLDPGFGRATIQQQEAAELQTAVEVTPENIGELTSLTTDITLPGETQSLAQQVSDEVVPSPASTMTQTQTSGTTATNQTQNQTGNVQTSQGSTGGVTQAAKATINIIIRRPGT
jgi:tetratricopeptide (TPR) repeat protein